MAEVVVWSSSTPLLKADNSGMPPDLLEAERKFLTEQFPPKTLLRKKETPMSLTNAAEKALHECLEILEPHKKELGPKPFEDLVAAAKPASNNDDDSLSKMQGVITDLHKAESETRISKAADRENLRQAVRKARAKVEAEYLARVSPVAARNMERDQANL